MPTENPLQDWIASLTGNLQVMQDATQSIEKDALLQQLHQTIPATQNLHQNRFAPFDFDKLQGGTMDALQPALREHIAKVAGDQGISEKDMRVFVRESPIRDAQALRSQPSWANGAAVAQSFGPFTNLDGRRLWFDFFRVERLVALYINGVNQPPLIFNIAVNKLWNQQHQGLTAPPLQQYDLEANSSIWIHSTLLAANAPVGKYTGLTISAGSISLSEMPVINADKTTVSANAVFTVKLQLRQQTVTDADPASPYGIDARNADYTLPQTLEFHFSGSGGSKLDAVGNAKSFMFGQSIAYEWKGGAGNYNAVLLQMGIPLTADVEDVIIEQSASPFTQLSGRGKIALPYWSLPFADLDLTHISPAAGIGAIGIIADKGITATWNGLQHGPIALKAVLIGGQPGLIGVATALAGNLYAKQRFLLWQDKLNKPGESEKYHPSSIEVDFGKQFLFQFYTASNGNELVQATVNANIQADKPIDVSARPIPIHSKGSFLLLSANKKEKLIMLYDDNIIADNFILPTNVADAFEPKLMSLALRNALFTTSDVSGIFLHGELSADCKKVNIGHLYTGFPVYKYTPTLPDPYAANIGQFQHFLEYKIRDNVTMKLPVMLLLSHVKFGLTQIGQPDNADISFHLLPYVLPQLDPHKLVGGITQQGTGQTAAPTAPTAMMFKDRGWSGRLDTQFKDDFALLDVSSAANQWGISFGSFGGIETAGPLLRKFEVIEEGENLQSLYQVPFKIDQAQVTSPGIFTRSFLLPQVAWEPVQNVSTISQVDGDPDAGLNLYPDDGGATRIFNNSRKYVPLAPKPVLKNLLERFYNDPKNTTWSYFTLPFGLKALAVMYMGKNHPQLHELRPLFEDQIAGGIQLQLQAGKIPSDKYPMFYGGTEQLKNLTTDKGIPASTLGDSVSNIFNEEFKLKVNDVKTSRGVPLERIDMSGYGASMFSNWANPDAQIALTSQVKLDVWVGRTAHEVIQVRSIVYPWAIHVVRTIILFRSSNGYVFRVDTGWKAESDGVFDFTYHLANPDFPDDDKKALKLYPKYDIHPGLVKGLYNIQNIQEINETPFTTPSETDADEYYLDENNITQHGPFPQFAKLRKISFDAEVLLEDVIQGGVKNRVASKGVIGYVQLHPSGVPLSAQAFTNLIKHAGGSIGGPINCTLNLHGSNQTIRVNSFDVSNEHNETNNHVFVAAARGSVVLPKDGSWSMVKHTVTTGEVFPLPEHITVPVIREGALKLAANGLELDKIPDQQLLRIANPTELISNSANPINYGFLQNTGTQKALFLTPAFQKGAQQLLSKTPPIFADAYHMMASKAIFPNIGDAISNFKDAVPLDDINFAKNALSDGGTKVLELIKIGNAGDAANYALSKLKDTFKLPSIDKPFYLVDEDFLKIYIDYLEGGSGDQLLNYNIDSLKPEAWKSKLSKLSMKIDLGPFKKLMTIKGNFDAKKGAESGYDGEKDAAGNTKKPVEVEFSKALETVMNLLDVLKNLSDGNASEAVKKGLKIAMSNGAGGAWEYKFEASKEISLLRFPFVDYENPTLPFKIEASMRVGMYFNAALMVTTDPKKLLPTAGAFVDFYGQMRVMCVSLAAATVYAVGQANLGIAGDTAKGPLLDMKFGFGVQLVVGLPVVGNVSVMYMIGVEIHVDKTQLAVSAFMLFKGHAELLGGIVSITITIEAKGTIVKELGSDRTNCQAQVTFAIDISIFLVINIDFSETWGEERQIA